MSKNKTSRISKTLDTKNKNVTGKKNNDEKKNINNKKNVNDKKKNNGKQKNNDKQNNGDKKNNDDIYIDDVFKNCIFENDDMIVIKKKTTTVLAKPFRDKNQTTWVDKYRPKTLNEIVGHDEVKQMLKKSIEKGDLPHLMFHGGSGTGKTSTVIALIMQLYGPDKVNDNVLELNASDENGINVVREKIIKFANIVVGAPDPKYPSPAFKIIILDEADSMTSEAQTALKRVMEETCDVTRFVFICNYDSKIIEAIKSRCADFRYNQIPTNLMIQKLKHIATLEKMDVTDDVLRAITDICDGDARRSINTLQNIKYIPQLNSLKTDIRTITINDIYEITSHLDKDIFHKKYWNKIITYPARKLSELVISITNSGYPLSCILECIKDNIIESEISSSDNKSLTESNMSELLKYLGKVERMITMGSDNYIQLLALISYINGTYKCIKINSPNIY